MSDEGAVKQVLQRRAKLFAQRGSRTGGNVHASGNSALVLRVGGEQYALPLPSILQVQNAAGVTPLPGAPSTLAGIINFRGAVFSVMDLAQIFTGTPRREPGKLVFLRQGGTRLSLWVDDVESSIPWREILPLEAAPTHLAGLIAPGVPLIDMSALLQHPAFTPARKNPL